MEKSYTPTKLKNSVVKGGINMSNHKKNYQTTIPPPKIPSKKSWIYSKTPTIVSQAIIPGQNQRFQNFRSQGWISMFQPRYVEVRFENFY